jgi:hypothetical protein
MKGTPVDQLVFGHLFPTKTQRDPNDFTHYVQRHLIPEVRREVLSYFGHLDTDEARYPGLDYTNRIHRIRLCRWQNHRKLFHAFDVLRLTPSEISSLTRWEGTKWAKDNHERMRREPVRNTAADHMPHWGYGEPRPVSRITGRYVPPRTLRPRKERFAGIAKDAEYEVSRTRFHAASRAEITTFLEEGRDSLFVQDEAFDAMDEDERKEKEDNEPYAGEEEEEDDDDDDEEEDDKDEEEDEEMVSVGEALNERLRTQAARRNAGDMNVVMDPEWEAWLAWFKSSVDRGPAPASPTYIAALAASRTTSPTSATSPTRSTPRSYSQQQQQQQHAHRQQILPAMMAAARAGRWQEIPRRHHAFLHQAMVAEQNRRLRQGTMPDEIVRVPARA